MKISETKLKSLYKRYAKGHTGEERTFGEKVYKFGDGSRSRAEAERFAKHYRDDGHLARIIAWDVPLWARADPRRRVSYQAPNPWAVPPDEPHIFWCVYVRKLRRKK
jgi:hypothetical protein